VAVGVDKGHRGREKASDHAPVWVQIRDRRYPDARTSG
jgi:exodeoxyribonuclease-3